MNFKLSVDDWKEKTFLIKRQRGISVLKSMFQKYNNKNKSESNEIQLLSSCNVYHINFKY